MKAWTALAILALLVGCNSQKPQASAASPQATLAAPSSASVTSGTPQPAQQTSTNNTAGEKLAEKYRLAISNGTHVPITVTLNGDWVGQWDNGQDVPFDTAKRGQNELIVDVQGNPDSGLNVTVYTEREGHNVNLTSFDFKGKPGKHSMIFVAR